MARVELLGWAAIGVTLAALSIPWFLWGSSRIVAGLPIWLWWHVGWMLLAGGVFWAFAERAWGIGVEPGADVAVSAADGDRSGTGGDRP